MAALRAKGVTAHGEALDVADKAALEAWVAERATALGGIDIVVRQCQRARTWATPRRPGGTSSRST